MTGEVVWDNFVVVEGDSITDSLVEDKGLEVTEGVDEVVADAVLGDETEGVADGVDVGLLARGIRLGVEVGVVDDAVVDESTGVVVLDVLDVLDVEGIAGGVVSVVT